MFHLRIAAIPEACLTDAPRADPAHQVVQAAQHRVVSGVMSHAGHRDLSARQDAGRFRLTAMGMVRDLRPEQLAVVNLEGDGLAAPSLRRTPRPSRCTP